MSNRRADWLQARWLIGAAAVVLVLAIVWALLVPGADWLARHDIGSAKGSLATARDAARGRLLTLGAGLVAIGALWFTARNFTLSREGQVTDRYTKAIEQLGSDKLDVRIGAIYALERIARDSPKDHPTVMEVLTAFIREHSREQWPRPEDSQPLPERSTRPDVQAAVTVAGRRNAKRDILPVNLARANLTGADLTGAHLSDADLTGAQLAHADLIRADLSGAHLARTDLTSADLSGAHLARTDLTSADLGGARLLDAELARAHLNAANLTSAQLGGADLTGAYLTSAHLNGADLGGADLTAADLAGADLTRADLSRAKLGAAHLNRAYLSGARLTGADLSGARLGGADLTGARLGAADLTDTSLRGADLTGADLTIADLRGADLTAVRLGGADLTADLTGARWPEAETVPEGWVIDGASGRLKHAVELSEVMTRYL